MASGDFTLHSPHPTLHSPLSTSSTMQSTIKNRKSKIENSFDLDITPMIDVTFLLLIFFLVTSMPETDTVVDLPEARHGDAVSRHTATVFTVGLAGLGEAPVYVGEAKRAETRLDGSWERQSDAVADAVTEGLEAGKFNVLVKAEKGVAQRDVARVMHAVSRVQGVQIHLAVYEPE